MKFCLACNATYSVAEAACSGCGFKPKIVDGFIAHAPELAHGGGGFDASYFPILATLEKDSFWFRARNELILWALDKYCAGFQKYLEIGCGTGYVLAGVAQHSPNAELNASEIFTAGLNFAAQRVPFARFMQMDARGIPFHEEFDVVGAFDVVEHIREDAGVFAEIHKALTLGGRVLVTVPQHQWLWSESDEYARHERRYSRDELHNKLKVAGFRIVRSTSFVSLLLPLMFASRIKLKEHKKIYDPTEEFNLLPWINTVLYQSMKLEISLIKSGVNFAAGGSRLVIAEKFKK